MSKSANASSPAARPWPSTIDRYLLSLLVPALATSLGTVLIALLLERLLRLFNILAQNNQALPAVIKLVLDLVPHYLGLALPAAFFVALFMVVAKLGDDNELDACLAGGRSIARLTLPFVVVAFLLSMFSAALFGYIQPHARYAYHAVMYAALNAGWDARLQAGTFAKAGAGYTLSADEVDETGRGLGHVFIRRMVGDREEITTSIKGQLTPTADGHFLELDLDDGETVRDGRDGGLTITRYQRLETSNTFTPDAPPYRERGGSERELSSAELIGIDRPASAADLTKAKLAGEFHARLARTLSLPLLPLLAIPLGMSAKRGKRTASLIVAAVLLLAFHHSLQMGESLAQAGKVPALIGVWTPYLLFGSFSGWLFSQSLARPGDNPVSRFVRRLEEVGAVIGRRLAPARSRQAKP